MPPISGRTVGGSEDPHRALATCGPPVAGPPHRTCSPTILSRHLTGRDSHSSPPQEAPHAQHRPFLHWRRLDGPPRHRPAPAGEPGDGGGDRRDPDGLDRGCRPRRHRGARRLRGLAGQLEGGASPPPPPSPRSLQRGLRRAGRAHDPRDGHRRPLQSRGAGLGRARPFGGRHRGSRGRELRGDARLDPDLEGAHRRLRPHHAVELADEPAGREGGPRPRRGLHGGGETLGILAALLDPLRRTGRGRGLSAGRLQPHHRRRPRRGRGAGAAPGRGHDLDHRLDPRRGSRWRARPPTRSSA